MAPSKSASTSAEESVSTLFWTSWSVTVPAETGAEVVSESFKLGAGGSDTSEIVSSILLAVPLLFWIGCCALVDTFGAVNVVLDTV